MVYLPKNALTDDVYIEDGQKQSFVPSNEVL